MATVSLLSTRITVKPYLFEEADSGRPERSDFDSTVPQQFVEVVHKGADVVTVAISAGDILIIPVTPTSGFNYETIEINGQKLQVIREEDVIALLS